ncbi:MAG: RsmB/NOP family class I SAM-dependent RNA methyltransferase [Thaumarchaeota archaeon]|nr:RsmB/NOP family class I SAM-dependent RNA methyltransferase [Nitrososphaerota archaeon]
MGVEEDSAEAIALALKAIKIQPDLGSSLKSRLYRAAREVKPSLNALKLARRMLHLYAINRGRVRRFLGDLLGEELSDDGRMLLELLTSSLVSNLHLGRPEKLTLNLRRVLSKDLIEEVEPWLGIIRSIKEGVIELPEGENYPRWFINMLRRILGKEEAENLMKFQDMARPPTYFTINKLLSREDEVLRLLEEAGVEFSEDERLKGIYIIKSMKRSRRILELARKGLIMIHDLSSYYAIKAMNPKPGDTILDVCAAPGTKTILMSIAMRNRGEIISIDSSPTRLRTHLRRVRRAGALIVNDILADATKPLPLNLKADIVLVDPPCSSTGLFWREPIYRWTIKPRHVRMFARLQAKILENSSRHVKPNGMLLYSTCSLTIEENELILEDFLKVHPEFYLEEVYPELGDRGLRGLSEARRLYPHRDRCNGFFLAKLVKRF